MVLSHVADSKRAVKGKECNKSGNLCLNHASQPAVLIKNKKKAGFMGRLGNSNSNDLCEEKSTEYLDQCFD